MNYFSQLREHKINEHVAKIRHDWGESDAKRDEGKTTPDTILRFDNILYATDDKWQILDVYKPKNYKEKLPVIVNVHGGGWIYGTKEVYQFYCMSLAEKGFAVVNFNYRLAPENKYPSSLEDTNNVFKWILKNQTVYNFDCDNIFSVGDSAGANLLALYAAVLTNNSLQKDYAFDFPQELKLKAIGLNCGKYNMRKFDLVFTGLFEKKSKYNYKYLDVITKISSNFPPVLLMTCQGDFLKNEIYKLIKILDKNHVPYQCNLYGTKKEPLWHDFHCDTNLLDAKRFNKTQIDFFISFLK